MSSFEEVRGLAVAVARIALTIPEEEITGAIHEGDLALAVGPILDPTLARDAGEELQKQLVLLRALGRFREAVESLRPAQDAARASAGAPDS